jgi:hypothetical protein
MRIKAIINLGIYKLKKNWLLLFISMCLLLLASCSSAGPNVTSFNPIGLDPNVDLLKPGKPIEYTISYVNGRKSSIFSNENKLDPFINVNQVLQFDPYLIYVETNNNTPQIDTINRTISWDLGILGPGEGDTFTVVFTVAHEIPIKIYEIYSQMTITGYDSYDIKKL